jgi:cell division protease FtsH
MVCEWGMSDAMGPLTFGKKEEQIFLGREIAQHTDYSEDTALRIDAEVKRIVMDAYSRSTEVLTAHKKELMDIADALLAREVLDADQVQKLARGEKLEEVASVTPPRPPADEGTRDRARDKEQRPPLVPTLPKPLTQE